MLTLPPPLALVDRQGQLPIRSGGIPYRQRPVDGLVGVVLHATDADTTAESLALYQTTKVEGDPYPALAYHFVVQANGTVEWCHDLAVETWHAGVEASAHYVSVCLPGAGGDEPAPPAQLAAGRELVRALERLLARPMQVRAHVELMAGSPCPGPRWRDLVRALAEGEGEP